VVSSVGSDEAEATMHVAITGATGLIGSALTTSLQRGGHVVHRVTRDQRRAGPDDIVWSVAEQRLDPQDLAVIDVVVHLAGEPIGARRWTDEQKTRIRDSRVHGTALLAGALASLGDDAPRVFVSGSAVGIYGDRGEETLDESSSAGTGFLAEVTAAWEAAADPARDAGLRVVHPRTGVVMAEDGPLIDKVELPFKLGVGGKVGNGRQWVPWIALEDEVRALEFLIDHDLSGPVNLVAPTPVRNAELTEALGRALHRPTLAPMIPVFAVRALYGEMGASLATDSQRVIPRRLLDAGFTWHHEDVHATVAEVFA
jgi:uncharacterized protein (TIGR01777 family)